MAELRKCRCGGEATMVKHLRTSSCGWGKSYLTYQVKCTKCDNTSSYFNDFDHSRAHQLATEEWNWKEDPKTIATVELIKSDASVALAMCKDTAVKNEVDIHWVIEEFKKAFDKEVKNDGK